jgi:hypothetical protein
MRGVHTNTIESFWALLKPGAVVSTTRYPPTMCRATRTSTCSVSTTGACRRGMFDAFTSPIENDAIASPQSSPTDERRPIS